MLSRLILYDPVNMSRFILKSIQFKGPRNFGTDPLLKPIGSSSRHRFIKFDTIIGLRLQIKEQISKRFD